MIRLRALAGAAAVLVGIPQLVVAGVIGTFEGDLSSPYIPWEPWSTATVGFTGTGATHGSQAALVTHNSSYELVLRLDGNPPLAADVAANDFLKVDVTVPADAIWRQAFLIMQGSTQSWNQTQYDLTPGATTTLSLNLNTTGLKAAAANSPTWWQIFVAAQGGDQSGAGRVTTTFDNFRLVPEPGAMALAGLAVVGLAMLRRRSR